MGEATHGTRPEAMSFQVDGVRIVGTFVDVLDRRAAVLILSGSGQLDRNSNSPKLKLHVSDAMLPPSGMWGSPRSGMTREESERAGESFSLQA